MAASHTRLVSGRGIVVDSFPRIVGILWTVGALWYFGTEAISASAFPGYSYARNYISDLGVPEVGTLQGRLLDSPLHAVMNAGFIGEGLLFFLGLVLLVSQLRSGWKATVLLLFGIFHSAGIVLVGLVPGSQINAESGLILWHGLGAVAAIAFGNLTAIMAGAAMETPRVMRRVGVILGVLGFISAVLLASHLLLPDGVWERGAVYTFIFWELVTGLWLLRTSRVMAPPA